MQVSEIRNVFQSLVDDRVDNVTFLHWLREATNTIGLKYGNISSVVVVDGDTLPADFNRAAALELSRGNITKDFEIYEDNTIAIGATPNECLLYYHRKPAHIPDNEDSTVPDIPPELHDALPLLCAATFYNMESLGDAEESAMGSKFAMMANNMINDRTKILRKRHRRISTFT